MEKRLEEGVAENKGVSLGKGEGESKYTVEGVRVRVGGEEGEKVETPPCEIVGPLPTIWSSEEVGNNPDALGLVEVDPQGNEDSVGPLNGVMVGVGDDSGEEEREGGGLIENEADLEEE